jgi:hypothetical protein
MEHAINQAAIDAMAEAVLNPEFQAALDAFEPSLQTPAETEDVPATDSLDFSDSFDDPEFAALAKEVEAEATTEVVPEFRLVAEPDAADLGMKISPFALLVNPAPAIAAAKHLESLALPRRVVFLFGKKGVTNNPEISRLDQDMDLEAEDELEEETEEAEITQ